MKFVARSKDGEYLTPRRNTHQMYMSRSGWSENIEDAKIFNTEASAKNSANRCPDKREFAVVPVEIKIVTQESTHG